MEKPLGFDGSINYFLAGGLGIQLRFDYNLKSNLTEDSKNTYNLTWSWITGTTDKAEEEWNVEGDVSLMVISGNLIYKVQGRGMFAPLFSGGVSYFTGKIKANTSGAYAITWISGINQYIDYFDIPAELNTSFSGIEFNFGGGADILFSSNVALNIDARYFLGKKIKEHWKIIPGKYNSNLNVGWTFNLSQEDAELFQAEFEPFELNQSFFKISAGLKIMF